LLQEYPILFLFHESITTLTSQPISKLSYHAMSDMSNDASVRIYRRKAGRGVSTKRPKLLGGKTLFRHQTPSAKTIWVRWDKKYQTKHRRACRALSHVALSDETAIPSSYEEVVFYPSEIQDKHMESCTTKNCRDWLNCASMQKIWSQYDDD
jgi:hypothetical protein